MIKTILVLEDSSSVRKILEVFLGKDYKVISKENGAEGLEWLQSGYIPDLIISDLQMPIMGGEEFIVQIKSSGYFKDIPIIMLSGLESSEDRIKILKLGAIDYIVKPFNPEELKLKVEILLNR
jgi:DNA-binding response OmpR family regulator